MLLTFVHRFGGDRISLSAPRALMRAFMGAVGKACPAAPALEMEPFHKRKFHASGGMTADKPCVMRDDFTDAIVASMGVSEIEGIRFSIQLFRQSVVGFL